MNIKSTNKNSSLFSRQTWVIIAVIGVVGLVFLLRDHTSHVLSLIPYLILLACPFMHLFMHKHHENKNGEDRKEKHEH